MITSGVTRLKTGRDHLLLAGRVRRDAFQAAPGLVALRLCGLTLAETMLVRDENKTRNVWTFRFILSAGLQAILAESVELSVVLDAVVLAFSPRVQALRAAIPDDPERVSEALAKLRDGFVLTSKGELAEPFAKRGPGLAAILDHYEHCDRLTHEIIGYRLHVVGGTFLGAARHGGAIDHDVDFDAAYLSEARDAASLKQEHVGFLTALFWRGESVLLVNQHGHVRRRHFKWRAAPMPSSAAPVSIDVFPAFIDEEGFYCRPTFVRIPGGEGLILPLRRTPFADREVWAPNRMVEKATSIFGAQWRAPDPFSRKPNLPGVKEALSGLALSDEDLLELAADMPARQAEQLRAVLAAAHLAEDEALRLSDLSGAGADETE